MPCLAEGSFDWSVLTTIVSAVSDDCHAWYAATLSSKNPMDPMFRIVPVASALHDHRAVDALLQAFTPRLHDAGGSVSDAATAGESIPTVWFVLTGGTEQRLLDAMAASGQTDGGAVLLLAHQGHNSLPAALETLARLQQDGRKGRVIYLAHADDEPGYRRLAQAVDDMRAFERLRAMRIGLLGMPSDWLVASMPAADAVRASWGPAVVPIPIEELYTALQVSGALSRATAGPPTVSWTATAEVPDAALQEALQVERAINRIVDDYRLDGIAVRCFDLVLTRRTTGCLALAHLNDRGVTAGCEGDLASTVGMAWARALLGEPSWMANPAGLDEQQNTLILAHCTVPTTMVSEHRLRTHFESGLGAAIEGRFDAGPVTILRVGGRRLEQVWLTDAELEPLAPSEDLCRTQVKVHLSDSTVSELLRRPLGNHLVMVRGHHGARLRAWWEAFGPG